MALSTLKQKYFTEQANKWNYILKCPMEDSNESIEFYRLQFIDYLLKLTDTMNKEGHDLDKVRINSANTCKALIMIVDRSGNPDPYSKAEKESPLQQEPGEIRDKLLLGGRQVLKVLKKQAMQNGNRIELLVELTSTSSRLIDYLLNLSRLDDPHELLMLWLEQRAYAKVLLSERNTIIVRQPNLKYQLESKSVFPLKFHLEPGLMAFFNKFRITVYGSRIYTLNELTVLLSITVQHYITEQNYSHSQIQHELSKVTKVPAHKIVLLEPRNLAVPALTATISLRYCDLYRLKYPAIGNLINPRNSTTTMDYYTLNISQPGPIARPITPFTPLDNYNTVHVSSPTPDDEKTPFQANYKEFLSRRKLHFGQPDSTTATTSPWCTPLRTERDSTIGSRWSSGLLNKPGTTGVRLIADSPSLTPKSSTTGDKENIK
jgi:hypothetical protein